jgi:hypothetical protein
VLPLARRRATALAAAGIALAAFVLYVATLAPGITWSNLGADGGDLLTAAFTWGIPHPTGYPTYLVILRVFAALVPVGEPAFRGNLMSAAAAGLAAGAVFLAARRASAAVRSSATAAPTAVGSPNATAGARPGLTASWVPAAAALVAAAGAAASRELWSQATITEVYALNALFAGVLLAGCAVALMREPAALARRSGALPFVLVFLLGLGLGNHVTLGFAVGPLVVVVAYICWRATPTARSALLLAASFAAGLAVYMYAPIASSQQPPVNWGHPHTVSGFWWMVSGSIYRGYAFGLAPSLFPGRVATWADFLLSQYTIIGLWLGLAGLYALWLRCRMFAAGSAMGVVLVSFYAIGYSTPDSFLYLIPAFLIFAVWIAAGLTWLTVAALRLPALARSPRRAVIVASGLLAAAAVAIPGFSLLANAASIHLRDDRAARDFVSAAFETAGTDSVILASDSERVFSLWYQTYLGDSERDVMVVSVPHLQFDWYWDDLRRQYPDRVPPELPAGFDARVDALIAHNLGVTPVFAASRTGTMDRYGLVEDGPIYRIDALR